MQDLRKSFRKDEDNSLSYNDLKLLSGLSKNHFLEWSTGEKRTLYLNATPEEVFNKNKEYWTGNDPLNIENVFDDFITSLENTEMSDIGKQLKKVLQLTSIGNTETQQGINDFFETDNISNMWELLNQTSRYMSGLMNDKKAFIKNRNKLKEGGVNLDINHGNWSEKEVFDKLNETMEQSELKMSFSDFLEYSEKFKKSNDLFDKFTDAYVQLDMFGYKQDKLKKPNNDMNNILNDSHHAFYAAHCDYFIADDINLTKKAKALYSNYKLTTNIFTVDEFIENEKLFFVINQRVLKNY